MEVSQEIWNEGRTAFANGVKELDCPYDMQERWSEWADWTCGYGEAVAQKHLERIESINQFIPKSFQAKAT